MIYAKVKGQHIEVYADPVYSDSVNFLSIKLEFSKEWKGYEVTAIFKGQNEKNILAVFSEESGFYIGDSTYLVPYEVIKAPSFTFSLIGTKNESRITTNAAQVTVSESGYGQGEAPSEPTPSEYEQLLALYQSAFNTAQSVRNDADDGLFKGDKGDKGDTGSQGPRGETGPRGLQGIQGVKGDKGDKGDAYILTENDKSDIANIVLNNMPDGDEVSY